MLVIVFVGIGGLDDMRCVGSGNVVIVVKDGGY